MSSCAASYCICSPRASFASATSASWPTADAPRFYHYASQHWAQFHRRSNQKPPPRRNRTLFGVAPSVADPWQSSNDLPLLNSNSVLHQVAHYCAHETSRPQLENSARFTALHPRPPCSSPHPYFVPSVTPSSTIDSRGLTFAGLLLRFRAHSPNFNTSPWLHSICIRPASAAPAASF